jgi:hypothetical protein
MPMRSRPQVAQYREAGNPPAHQPTVLARPDIHTQ